VHPSRIIPVMRFRFSAFSRSRARARASVFPQIRYPDSVLTGSEYEPRGPRIIVIRNTSSRRARARARCWPLEEEDKRNRGLVNNRFRAINGPGEPQRAGIPTPFDAIFVPWPLRGISDFFLLKDSSRASCPSFVRSLIYSSILTIFRARLFIIVLHRVSM